MGAPHFCWSDAERELKSWVVTEVEAVEAALAGNEKKAEESAKSETDRRAALVAKTCQQFTVMAKSTNTGGLAQRQYILARRTAARGRCIVFASIPGRWGKSSACRS